MKSDFNKAGMKKHAEVLPLMLLLTGRRAVVVGAGGIALRKVRTLLAAGAEVVVVAPKAGPGIRSLCRAGRISWRERGFRSSDVSRAFLVFAATDLEEVNNRVLGACRKSGRLCGIVDRGWRQGDFISPAVLGHEGLTIAVSSGGASCQSARSLRDNLGKMLRDQRAVAPKRMSRTRKRS